MPFTSLVMAWLQDTDRRSVRLHLIDIAPFHPNGLTLHDGLLNDGGLLDDNRLLLDDDRLLHDRRRRHDRRSRLDNHRFTIVRTHQG